MVDRSVKKGEKMPKIVDKEQKRKEIAKAAIDIFAQKGFENTTIQEIAKAASIGKGTFYQYFETKEHVLMEVAMEIFRKMENSIDSSFLSLSDPRKKLKSLMIETMGAVDEMEKVFNVYMELFLIHMRSGGYGIPLLVLEDMLVMMRKLVSDIILDGKKRGIFKQNVDHKAISIYLVASLDGVAMHYVMDKSKFDTKKIVKDFMDVFFKGLVVEDNKKK